MEHITRIGKFHFGLILTKLFLFIALIAVISLTATSASAQICEAGSEVPVLHAEGLTEQIGDIVLTCSGGSPGTLIVSYLYISLNATVTNALDKNGNILGVTTSVDTGSGPVTESVNLAFDTPMGLVVNGARYTVPTPNTQMVVIRVSGVRIAAPTIVNPNGNNVSQVNGTIVAGGVTVSSSQKALLLGETATSLLESTINNGIPCAGSPLPNASPLTFQSFITGNDSSSAVRLTEATMGLFSPRDKSDPTVTNGTRFLVNLSGYGAAASLYVPNAIVGSSGSVPTSGGEFATVINAGTYTPGQNQLLLALVTGADATGAGGTLSFTIPSSTTTFTDVSQITLTGGAGYAVYEVLDTNLDQVQWAQIPVFLVTPANTCATSGQVTLGAMIAPVSSDAKPSVTDPIPRFLATTPASDCSVVGDCSASYFPLLEVAPVSGVSLTGSSLGDTQPGFITVGNGGSSQLAFTISTTYQTASGLSVANWLTVDGTTGTIQGVIDPVNGFGALNLRLIASPAALLVPGAYKATVTINAGAAGTVAVPVTFNVAPAGAVIQSVVNSANFQAGPVAPGSFATIFGLNLAKKNTLTVVLDGLQATVVYDSPQGTANPTQINILLPTGLPPESNAGVTATVDGVVSNTFPVPLALNAPGVFTPGILNQDNSVNLATAPGSDGDVVQVFLTGLAIPLTGTVTVNIGSANGLVPTYTGAVASIPGLEQVNVQVPASLTFSGNSAPLSICLTVAGAAPLCSAPVSLYLH